MILIHPRTAGKDGEVGQDTDAKEAGDGTQDKRLVEALGAKAFQCMLVLGFNVVQPSKHKVKYLTSNCWCN